MSCPGSSLWLSQLAVDASGKTPTDWKQNRYAEYYMIDYDEADLRCYRTPRVKPAVDAHHAARNEFFDLKNVPAETHNLCTDQRPEIQTAIKDLTHWLNSTPSEIENTQ